jgi:hypothetical protein
MFSHIFLIFLAAISATATGHKERVGGFRLKQFINKFSDKIPITGLTSSIVGGGFPVAIGSDNKGMEKVIRIRGGMSNPKQAGAALFLTSLLNSYTGMLDASPYTTKIITSAIIGGLGDYIVQIYQARKSNASIDYRRVMVFAAVCGLYLAPVIHVWFNYLNGMKFLNGLGNVQKALSMMLVDQSIGATAITFGFFFAFEAVRFFSAGHVLFFFVLVCGHQYEHLLYRSYVTYIFLCIFSSRRFKSCYLFILIVFYIQFYN